jgi:hypothetical protein
MPVVDEQVSQARTARRGAKWLVVTLAVLAVLLVTVVMVPMYRPVGFVVGTDHYSISAGYRPDWAAQYPPGFSHYDHPWRESWNVRVGGCLYTVYRVPNSRAR